MDQSLDADLEASPEQNFDEAQKPLWLQRKPVFKQPVHLQAALGEAEAAVAKIEDFS